MRVPGVSLLTSPRLNLAVLPVLTVLALLTHPAMAKSTPPSSTAVPSGAATVPLYGGVEATDPFFYVEARVGDHSVLLRLDTASAAVHLSKAAADRLGLKPSKSKTRPNASLPSLAIGSMTLEKVAVWVDESVEAVGALPVDGSIGLLAFPNVSWAVLPSKGTVTVGPNADGAALVAAIGGRPSPQSDAAHLVEREVRVGRDRVTLTSDSLTFTVPVSGVPLPVVWASARAYTEVATEVDGTTYALAKPANPNGAAPKTPTPLPPANGRWQGATRVEPRLVNEVITDVRRQSHGAPWLVDAVSGSVGIDVTQRFDLALDNGGHSAAIAPAVGIQKADYGDVLEARLKLDLLAGGAAGDGAEDGPPPTPAQLADKKNAALRAYADFLEARARGIEAIPLRKQVAESAPDECEGWLGYGQALLAGSDPKEAADVLLRAQALYSPWAARPLTERKAIEADKAKAERSGEPWTGEVPQSNACYVATGHLAAARLLTGDYDGVTALYAQLDLDPGLARIAGVAALAQGKEADAQARFRQAQKLHGVGDDEGARVGLFLAYRHLLPALAEEQVQRSRFQFAGHTDPLTLAIWIEDQRTRGGALEPLRALVAAAPNDAVLLAALSSLERREAVQAGLAPTQGDATALRALAAFDRALDSAPRDGRIWATYALFLIGEHRFEEAGKATDLALLFAPQAGEAWYAAAVALGVGVVVHEGTAVIGPEKVAEMLKKAAAVGYANPAYAMLGL